jgi:hypothetical protein
MSELHQQQEDSFFDTLLRVQQILIQDKAVKLKEHNDISRLDLAELVQKRFSAAVVGQMRSGKSTLINALIGKDIAPTAVNECTATINHFSYSDKPELHEQFRVRWLDDSEDYFPLSEVEKWLGKGVDDQNTLQKVVSRLTGKVSTIDRTKRLEFFAATRFLETANIVDTPGSRSTIDEHEQNALSVISRKVFEDRGDKLEKATRNEGESADAVVYVLNSVARENDADMLDLFGDNTRLSGSNPYNSVAVVHMWEMAWDDMEIDPVQFLEGKINRIQQQLKGKVSTVMAASALLSRCQDWLQDEHWVFFVQFGNLSRDEVKKLTRSSAFEVRESNSGISLESRKAVIESIKTRLMVVGGMGEDNAKSTTLAITRFLCRFACVRSITRVDELQRQVRELSGMEQLETLLEKQFFARASLIKNGKLLTRIWEPCQIALEQLRRYEQDREDDLEEGKNILKLLEERGRGDAALLPAVAYVKKTFEAVSNDALRVKQIRKELFALSRELEREIQSFEEDIQALELIDTLFRSSFSGEEVEELRRLFGAKGLSLEERLNSSSPTREYVQKRYSLWAQKRMNSYGDERKIAILAEKHLEHLLDTQLSRVR